jgi:hypothetical protein
MLARVLEFLAGSAGDFVFSPLDDRVFRLRYIDMAPSRRMRLLDEKAVLKYAFEQR